MDSTNFHEYRQDENQLVMDSSYYGLPWYHNNMLNDPNFSSHELELPHFTRIKNELSVTGSCFELPDIISSEDFIAKANNKQFVKYNNDNVNNQDMLLKTFSNGYQVKYDHLMNPIPSFENIDSCYRGTFSQIFPSLKFSNSSQPASSLDMNLPDLDSFGFPTFNAHNLGDLLKDNCLSYSVDQMHTKIAPTFIVKTREAKRPANNGMDVKATPKANPTKKSKVELRPSCAQLKVRKEKLGDRILALQQMVAPFGKTDTASVLMEAIGYIKFLQNQVETLSMPYMNSTPQAGLMSAKDQGLTKNGNEETKRDLKSRGLCLVPVSCLTYVTYGGGSVWATL